MVLVFFIVNNSNHDPNLNFLNKCILSFREIEKYIFNYNHYDNNMVDFNSSFNKEDDGFSNT